MPRRPKVTAAQICADGFLTPDEACEQMRIGRSLLYKLMRDGALPYCQVTEDIRRIPAAAINEFMASRLTSGSAR
jgi:excisionase family DNA binding protein